MMPAAGMKHQNLGIGIGLLRHVGKVVAVVAGQRVAEHHDIKLPAAQRSLKVGATDGLLNVVAGALEFWRLLLQHFGVEFAVKDPAFGFARFLLAGDCHSCFLPERKVAMAAWERYITKGHTLVR